MRLPPQNKPIARQISPASTRGGVKPGQLKVRAAQARVGPGLGLGGFGLIAGRFFCVTGPCRNGRRLHSCYREVIECIQVSPGSPGLGIPPGPPHCFVTGFERTHDHEHPCPGGFRLDVPVRVVASA